MKTKNFSLTILYSMFILQCMLAYLNGYLIFYLFDMKSFLSVITALIIYLSSFFIYDLWKGMYNLHNKMRFLYE